METGTEPRADLSAASLDPPPARTFPEPSLTLVEFGDALGVLVAARTERDTDHRRIVLKKVGYIRLEPGGWGGTAYPEIHILQNAEGLFVAVEPRTNKILRHPSRRRYEIAFIGKDLFDCAIQCLRERDAEPLAELIAVTFAGRDGFSVEHGCLVAPDDYAAERTAVSEDGLLPTPPRFDQNA